MAIHRIEVALRPDLKDPSGEAVIADLAALGLKGVTRARTVRVYLVEGDLSPEDAETLARELFADKVADVYAIDGPVLDESGPDLVAVEIVRRPGVMDPVQGSALRAVGRLGIPARAVRTARRVLIWGKASPEEVEAASRRGLANEVIEEIHLGERPKSVIPAPIRYEFKEMRVPILDASPEKLVELSKRMVLSLNLEEMRTVQEHFKALGREPRDVELETIAQTWSEHCVHKTLRAVIEMDGETIDNLLKSTIMKVTDDLAKPWCLSVFKDNAGVIAFDEEWAVCFKVETHNHPSAIEPYGGAGTGIGGVIRDPLGTGLGAKPVASTDIFCFAPLETPFDELPPGVLHPLRVMRGVVAGVRDYGNRMGIPTVNGAIYFDERYLGNPLVYCGNVGLMPRKFVEKAPGPGDRIFACGGRTGRDGIHGATFSSVELTEESERMSSGAVQIGNAIEEKKLVDVILQARDRGLYTAITDCGAAGLSSAIGEMGEKLGAEVELSLVPLKYEGLSYTEIWISEAQERMVLAVPPEKAEELKRLFESEDVEATDLGSFTGTGRLVLRYEGNEVADLPMDFLHEGLPRRRRKAEWRAPSHEEPDPEGLSDDLGADLKRLLSSPNIASKEWVIRQYDHEVQGGSALKPLVGVGLGGPGDGAVVAPVLGSRRCIVLSCGMNPCYGDIDPYAMACAAVDEAVRNAVSCGADPERIALLDNFCWGNSDDPQLLGALVLASRGAADAARAYGAPFVSGKDSLNNEFSYGGKTISIPPTLLISAIGILEDVSDVRSMDLKQAGNLLYVVGVTKRELGGSHFYKLYGKTGSSVPSFDPGTGPQAASAVRRAVAGGLARSIHDLSEGGLGTAAAEMCFAGGLGAELDLAAIPTEGELGDAARLFSESNSRYLVEVEPERAGAFEECLSGVPRARVGRVLEEPALVVRGLNGKTIVRESLAELERAWRTGLPL